MSSLYAFEVPKWLSLGLIVAIFTLSYAYARRVGAVEVHDAGDAEALLRDDAEGAGESPQSSGDAR